MTSAWVRWIRRPVSRPGASRVLVCFPHAGGGAARFRDWAAELDRSVELVAVQYPGREDREAEPRADSLESMADEVTAALSPLRGQRYALFGHSMGALLAHAVAARTASGTVGPPERLFVSGSPPPGTGRPPGTTEPGEEHLRRWGEVTTACLGSERMRERVVRTLTGDLELLEGYRPEGLAPLPVPISALGGRDDADAPPEQLRGWDRHTTARFDHRVFPGAHGYLHDRRPEVLAHVQQRLGVVSAQPDWTAP